MKILIAARRPPGAALTLARRGLGPDVILERVHERAPDGFADIHDVMPGDESRVTAARCEQLAGFDPKPSNERESHWA